MNLRPKSWFHVGCGTLPEFLEEQTTLTPRQAQKLSERSLLPKSQRIVAFQEGIPDGPLVLKMRQASDILPTLVASYRRQCDLPATNLSAKGVLTWLVPGMLGNAVAPLQVAPLLYALWNCHDGDFLTRFMKFRLYGGIPLSNPGTITIEGLKCLTPLSVPQPVKPVSGPPQVLSCDGSLCPLLQVEPQGLRQSKFDICLSPLWISYRGRSDYLTILSNTLSTSNSAVSRLFKVDFRCPCPRL